MSIAFSKKILNGSDFGRKAYQLQHSDGSGYISRIMAMLQFIYYEIVRVLSTHHFFPEGGRLFPL